MHLARGVRLLLTWLFLAAQCVASMVPVQGFVLCVEPDGQVEVEYRPGGIACAADLDAAQAANSSRPSFRAHPDGCELCCGCVDLTIAPTEDRVPEPVAPLAAPAPSETPSLPPRSVSAPCRPARDARGLRHAGDGEEGVSRDVGLRALSTIILRI